MRLFLREPEIGDLEGFTTENDIFERKAIGDGLSYLLANVEDPLVLALDAPWGAGKSVFLRQWAGELRNAGYPVVLFDAFKHDYAEDAFAALAGEIIALVDKSEKERTPQAVQLRRKAVQALKAVARPALKTVVKVATMNAVDTDEIGKEAAKIIADETASLEDRYLGELITRQKERQGAIEDFRQALERLPSLLRPETAVNDRPLVFIVDELDRCRPQFALELLERIKHFFSVPNVHFVLGVHLAQLRNSMIAAYGAQMDAATYLQKFIHFSVRLDDTATHQHERSRSKAINRLRQELALGLSDQYVDLVLHVAEARTLSLRTIEKVFTTLALAETFSKGLGRVPAPGCIVAGLCILKVNNPELYDAARLGRLAWADVAKEMALELGDGRSDSIAWFAKAWAYITDGPLEQHDQLQFQFVFDHRPKGDRTLLPFLIRRYIELVQPPA